MKIENTVSEVKIRTENFGFFLKLLGVFHILLKHIEGDGGSKISQNLQKNSTKNPFG